MMPSADDTCASCGCTPGAERDDVADRRDVRHRRAIQLVDLDVAALHRDAELFGAEPGRHRPAAGRDEQHVGRQLLRLAVGACASMLDAARPTPSPSSPSCR